MNTVTKHETCDLCLFITKIKHTSILDSGDIAIDTIHRDHHRGGHEYNHIKDLRGELERQQRILEDNYRKWLDIIGLRLSPFQDEVPAMIDAALRGLARLREARLPENRMTILQQTGADQNTWKCQSKNECMITIYRSENPSSNPLELGFKFCPGCGRKIIGVKPWENERERDNKRGGSQETIGTYEGIVADDITD